MLAKKKDEHSFQSMLLLKQHGRSQKFIEENYDNDAVFECPRCKTQMIGWAIALPACPDCGHHPMDLGMLIW